MILVIGLKVPKDRHMYSDLVTEHLGMDSIIKMAEKFIVLPKRACPIHDDCYGF
jgi:hypothetical protein